MQVEAWCYDHPRRGAVVGRYGSVQWACMTRGVGGQMRHDSPVAVAEERGRGKLAL